jgi:hypothetical protein
MIAGNFSLLRLDLGSDMIGPRQSPVVIPRKGDYPWQ